MIETLDLHHDLLSFDLPLATQVAEGPAGAPAGGPAAETRAAACRHLGTQAAVAQAAAATSAASAGPLAVPEEACSAALVGAAASRRLEVAAWPPTAPAAVLEARHHRPFRI